MSLPVQAVAFPFVQGIDTKSDPKAIPIGKLAEMENCVFTRTGILTKRNGYSILPRTIEGSTSTIQAAQAVATYGDELLLFSGTRVYSYSTATAKWQDRGAATPVSTSSVPIVRNTYQQNNPDCAELANVRLVAWEDTRGGIRYSVQDVDTGAFYASDLQASATGSKPKVVAFNGELVLFYSDGANLNYRRVATAHPSVLGSQVNVISTLVTGAGNFDALTVGARLFIGWNSQTGSVTQLAYLDTLFVLSTTVSLANAATNCIGLVGYATGSSVAVLHVDATTVRSRPYSYNLVPIAAVVALDTVTGANRVTGAVADDSSTLQAFWDVSPGVNQPDDLRIVRGNTLSTVSNVAGTAAVFLRSVGLWSKAFVYGASVYVWTTHGSRFQNTYYLVDSSGRVVSKANPGTGGGIRTNTHLAEVATPSVGVFDVALQQASRLASSGGVLYTLLGASVHRTDFVSNSTFSSAAVGRSLVITGGIVQMYDGARVVEQGFFQYPESLSSTTTGALVIAVTTPGSGGAAQVTDVTPPLGSRIRGGQWFDLYTSLDAIHYQVWFSVDGYGAQPATLGVSFIQVPILSADSIAQITAKTRTAILAAASASVSVVDASTKITITNNTVGATTSASNAAAPDGVGTGAVGVGTYQYVALYEWTDNAGQIHRSVTSLPLTVTLAAPGAVSIRVPTLRLTLKSDVRVAVYRTVTLGSLFYRLTELSRPTLNSTTADAVTFLDVSPDASIVTNELLYTTGGVLDNFSPPSASLIASYRGRAFIAGLADKNQIAYSTETLPGEPVAFSEVFTIACDARGGDVTALAVLDDKLIIFKESAIFYLFGEGPTSTGAQNDYGDPQLVAADTGCSNPNSVVATPNGLMFQSPKGTMLLDRSMQCQYIGAAVEAYNSVPVTGAVLVPNTNRIQFVTASDSAVIYDYLYDQWGTFTNHTAVDCDVWRGAFCFVRSNGQVYVEQPGQFTDGGDRYIKMKVTTGWISFANMQGYQRVRRVLVLGDYRGPHKLKMSIANDYSPAYTQVRVADATTLVGTSVYGSDPLYGVSTTYGGPFTPYQFEIHVKNQKSQAFRVSVEDYQSSEYNEGCAWNGLTFEVGVKKQAPVRAARSF